MDSGEINIFDVVNQGKNMVMLNTMKAHAARVMGISFDFELGYLYSVGEDGMLKVTDTNVKEPVCEVAVGSSLKSLVHDKTYQRLFIGDDKGTVSVYSLKNMPPTLIGQI